MQLTMQREIKKGIRPFGHIPYNQGCECILFSGSIDTLIETKNEEVC